MNAKNYLFLRTKLSLLFLACLSLFGRSACFQTTSLASLRHQVNIRGATVRLAAHQADKSTDDNKKMNSKDDDSLISRGAFLSTLASASVVAATKSADAAPAPIEQAEQHQSINSSRQIPSILNSKKQESKTFQESISGFVAGGSLTITKTFVKYPLDTATVRLQMPNTDYSIRDPLRLFNGSYRGVLAPLLWNVPAGAIFFAVKDATKSILRDSGMPRWATTSLAVAAAQCPYWLVRNPSEVVKTRQQAGVEDYGEGTSTLEAFRMVYDEGKNANNGTGIGEFYSGYWENIIYALPADVIKFVCYDAITQGKKNLPPLEGAVAGAASTAVAQLLTTPLDVVRNRVMAGEEPESEKSPSYVGTLVKLAQQEGASGLFAGASPRVGKAILSGAIQFATYEETKQKLSNFFQNQS